MQSTYITSTIAFRTKVSLDYSLNDHYLSNNTSSCCSPCTCCAIPFHELPLKPRSLYGLRQSTLIHWSASRRLILGGGDRYSWLSVNDVNPFCSGNVFSLKESRSDFSSCSCNCNCSCRNRSRRRERGEQRRISCMASEEKCENFDLGTGRTAEAMLSLLNEKVCEKLVGVRKRNVNLEVRGVEKEMGRRDDGGFYWEEEKYVESESLKNSLKGRRESGDFKSRVKAKYMESDYSKRRNLMGRVESDNIKLREEERKWSEGREGTLRVKNSGLRKENSHSSSYYYAFSADDNDECDLDVQVDHRSVQDEYWNSNKNKETRRGQSVNVENVKKQSKWSEVDHREENKEMTDRGNTETRSNIVAINSDSDFRNEKERKLRDLSVPQSGSRKQSMRNISDVREIHDTGSEMSSATNRQSSGREENSIFSMDTVDDSREKFRQTGYSEVQHAGSKRKSQQFTAMLDIRDSEIEKASSSTTQFGERDERRTEIVNLIHEAREELRPTSQSSSGQDDSRMKSQQFTGTSKIHESDIQRTSTSLRLPEIRLKNRDESSTLVVDTKGKQSETMFQPLKRNQSTNQSLDPTNIPITRVSDTSTVIDTQNFSKTEVIAQGKKSDSIMHLIEEAIEGQSLHSEQNVQKEGTSEKFQRPTSQLTFHGRPTENSSSSQAPFAVQQATELRVTEKNDNRKSAEVVMTPPPSQYVKRAFEESTHHHKVRDRYATQRVSSESSVSGSMTLSTDFALEGDCGTRNDKIYQEHSELYHEDALGSANRLTESSTQFVGEFAEKLRHEVLTSKVLEERTSSQTTSANKDERYTQNDSSQQVSEDFYSQVHGSKRSSFGSGGRGPPDKMWDVVGPSSQEPPGIEAPGIVTPSIGSTVSRSSRSLWSIVGDILQLRWGTHSETQKSNMKSGMKSSSNESMGSEGWFSSHESDDKDDENVKKGRKSTPKMNVSTDRPAFSKSSVENQGDASGIGSNRKLRQTEADKSSSSGTVESSSASKGAYSEAREESVGWKEVKTNQGILSSISTADSSLPLSSRRFLRSPPLKEDIPESEISQVEISTTGLMEMAEPVIETPSGKSRTEVKDGELKQRRIQRSKQVPQERFEEWEEAYRLESEQRRLDEMFMREALLEAKRAADTWEVPVGAVLVKDGKVIACGCNLVEDLRDATAHAEMICIREASNQLRTWRLANTTLYVTLEPCAMCAGAILQARIDAVVWGAPNKLLGADGSWVRLFPSGSEGESSSDQTNQSTGPVHPFHPKMTIRRGVLSTECADVMQQFFQLRRKKKKPESPPTSCLPMSHHPSKFVSRIHDIFSIMFCM